MSALLLLATAPGPSPIPCDLSQAAVACSSGGPALNSYIAGMGQGLWNVLSAYVALGPVGLLAICIAAWILVRVGPFLLRLFFGRW